MAELRNGKQPQDYLFTGNLAAIRDFRKTWDALITRAVLPRVLLHDFRRSAVRNMIRRGVPQKTAREISGHKTDSVFNRYNLVSEVYLQHAARKVEAGAKGVILSSFTVAQESGTQRTHTQRKGEKPEVSVKM